MKKFIQMIKGFFVKPNVSHSPAEFQIHGGALKKPFQNIYEQKNRYELFPDELGKMVFYRLTKEEQAKYNQKVAPAFIVRGWVNEYSQEDNPEYRVGLNLKVLLDNDDMLYKLSVKRCKEHSIHEIGLDDIPHGEYLYCNSLLMLDRNFEYKYPEYWKRDK